MPSVTILIVSGLMTGHDIGPGLLLNFTAHSSNQKLTSSAILLLTFIKSGAVVDLCLEPGVRVALPGLLAAAHLPRRLEHEVVLGGPSCLGPRRDRAGPWDTRE